MNQFEIYRDYGKVDIKVLESFEIQTGFKLPIAYKMLLSEHDAVIPDANHFEFIDRSNNLRDSRDVSFDGFGERVSSASRMRWPQNYDIYGHEGLVTVGTSANGDYICFDYRHDLKTDQPKVVVMFHDYYDENQKMLICPVANSFEEFMDSLYKPEED
jgi:SMI1-KNR4 cell-wall